MCLSICLCWIRSQTLKLMWVCMKVFLLYQSFLWINMCVYGINGKNIKKIIIILWSCHLNLKYKSTLTYYLYVHIYAYLHRLYMLWNPNSNLNSNPLETSSSIIMVGKKCGYRKLKIFIFIIKIIFDGVVRRHTQNTSFYSLLLLNQIEYYMMVVGR